MSKCEYCAEATVTGGKDMCTAGACLTECSGESSCDTYHDITRLRAIEEAARWWRECLDAEVPIFFETWDCVSTVSEKNRQTSIVETVLYAQDELERLVGGGE